MEKQKEINEFYSKNLYGKKWVGSMKKIFIKMTMIFG